MQTVPDSGVVLPAAVQAAIDNANNLIKQGSTPTDPPANDPAPATAPVQDPAPAGDPPANEAAPAAQEPPAPAPAKEPKTYTLEEWARRYAGLEGRFKGEREKLLGQVTNLNDEVAQLRRTVAQLEGERLAQPQLPVASELNLKYDPITAEEEADYGPDLLKLIERKAGAMMATVADRYEREITDLKKKVSGVEKTNQVVQQEDLFKTLTRRVPNWSEINENPQFLSWLTQPDGLSGQIRQGMLDTAFNKKDAARVASFFETFLREQPAAAPRAAADPGPGPAPKASLEQFAAPGRAMSSAPVASGPEDKPVISAAFITQFYQDSANGKYRGKPEEYNRVEAQIYAAQAEGRVR